MPSPQRSHPQSFHLPWLTLIFALVALVALPRFALAHNPISSWAILDLQGEKMELKVEMATESAWLFLGETLEQAPNVQGSMPRLRSLVPQVYELSVDGHVLVPVDTGVELEEEDAVVFRLVYPRPHSGPLHCDAIYLKRLPPDHRSTLTLLESQKTLHVDLLNAAKRSVNLTLPATAGAPQSIAATSSPVVSQSSAPAPVQPVVAPPPAASFGDFFKLGIEHILTGYDHLLFLLGLLVVCRRWSSMLTIITCFTLAHSLTLALAALNLVSIPSRIVEPLIAASIVFVGVENLLRSGEPKARWLLTFCFGLIHGFGFAGVLRQIGLGAGGSSVALPLFSFNLGVEAGQLAVVAVLLPLLLALRTRPLYVRRVEPLISIIVVLLGGYWLLQRTLFT